MVFFAPSALGDQTTQNVLFVRRRHGEKQIRSIRPRFFEILRDTAISAQTFDVVTVDYILHRFRIFVYRHDVVAFLDEALKNISADLPKTDNDYFHLFISAFCFRTLFLRNKHSYFSILRRKSQNGMSVLLNFYEKTAKSNFRGFVKFFQ